MEESVIQYAIGLRKKLHEMPELALHEYKTKETLIKYIAGDTDLKIFDMGSWFCAYYKGTDANSPIAFRADFDAVSGKDGQPGHFCGHDGHSAVLAAFAKHISLTKPERSVCLIFQPAEETGQGALLCRSIIKEMNISEIYAFHNIPGYPVGTILLRENTFACASTGLEITITGTPSHAAYPEKGKNPADILAHLMLYGSEILSRPHRGLVLSTVIGCQLGSEAYGVSASQGTLRLTLRAEYNDEYNQLIAAYTDKAIELSEKAGMICSVRKVEAFAATENTPENVHKLKHAAEALSAEFVYPEEPFRWSEDFGYYLEYANGAYFGIGSGDSCPQLHTENYEFPDEVIRPALDIFAQMLL